MSIQIHTHEEMPQLSDAWMLARCGSLGSSNAKNACAQGSGKSRKTLAYQLAAESVTGIKSEIRTTHAMQWGIDTEPEARAYFELSTGIEVEECGLITNDDFPGMHCSPDGIFTEGDYQCGLEIKCPQPATHAKYIVENRLPPEYKAQVHYSLMVSGRMFWYFMSYHPAFDRQLVLKVERDMKYQQDIKDKLDLFMAELEAIKEKIC